MRIKGYSKKRIFGLLLLPVLACSLADGIDGIGVTSAAAYTVDASTVTTAYTLTGTDLLTVTSTGIIDVTGEFAVTVDTEAAGVVIDNAGTIAGEATSATPWAAAIHYAGTLDATLDNSGTLSATLQTSYVATAGAYGVGIVGDLTGSLDNSGSINVSAIAQYASPTTLSVQAYGIGIDGNLSGTLDNSGTISVSAAARSGLGVEANAYGLGINGDLSGELNNSGTIEASATASDGLGISTEAVGVGIDGELSGELYNSGDILATVSASETSGASVSARAADAYGIAMGDLAASGLLVNSGTIGALLNASAVASDTATANARAVADDYAQGIAMGELAGILDNSGTIAAEITISATATGNIANADADGQAYDLTGISLGDIAVGGSLLNSGIISSLATVTATANGVASADTSYAAAIEMDTLYGTLNNSGTLSATLNATANASDAYAYAKYASGINMGDIEVGGSLTNESTISAALHAAATANGVTSADAYASASYAYGIDMDTLYGTLNNSGSISALVDARALATASGDGTYGDASASASASYAYGIYMSEIEAGASLTNSGSISAAIINEATANGTSSADASAEYAYYAYGIEMSTLYGTLNNSGSIAASIDATAMATASVGDAEATVYEATDAYGIYMYDIEAGASLTNSGSISATITAVATANGATSASASVEYASYAYGIDMGTLYGSLNNSGTISASIDAQATAISTEGEASATVYEAYEASGITLSNIEAGASLTNSGSISAAITAAATANGATDAYASIEYASDAYGIDMSTLYGTLNNSGTISASISATSTAQATDGAADAEVSEINDVYSIYMNSIETSGNLTNSGSISASLSAAAYATGTTSASATLDDVSYVYGIEMGDLSGTLNNSGSISASADATAQATASAGYAYASVSSVADIYGLYMNSIEAGGSLLNSGSITAAVTSSATANGTSSATAYAYASDGIQGLQLDGLYGVFNNSGTITATAEVTAEGTATAGDAEAYAYGSSVYGISMGSIYAGGLANGDFVNSGTIGAMLDVTATATAENSATATADGSYVGGVWAGEVYDTLSNSGSILAGADIEASATGSNANAHAYASTITALHIGNLDAAGSVTNSGTIAAAAVATAAADGSTYAYAYASAEGKGIEAGTISGTLDNSGVISASVDATASASADIASSYAYAWAYGIDADAIATGAELNNSNLISAMVNADADDSVSAYAYGVRTSNLSGTLVNSGIISGLSSDLANGYSIYADSGTGLVSNELGGLLSGNLYLGGSINVNNSGTLSLPVGAAASVGGDYTQSADGMLRIAALSSSNYAQLSVDGTATFADAAKLDVIALAGNSLISGDVLEGVISAGSVEASSFTVTDNSALLEFEAVINEVILAADGPMYSSVDLEVTRIPVASIISADDSEGALGGAALFDTMLNDYDNPDYAGLTDVLDALNELDTAQQVADAVNSTTPSLKLNLHRAVLNSLHEVRRVVQVRMDDNQGMNSGDAMAVNGKFWGKLYGSKADQDDADGAFGYTSDSYGIMFGGDTNIGGGIDLGAALAFTKSNVDGNGAGSQEADVDSYQGILYGNHDLGNKISLDWQADFAIHKTDTERDITFMGTKAEGSYDAWSAHAGVGVDRRYAVSENTTLVPAVKIDYTYIDEDGYTEKGAGPLNLKVESTDADELILGVDGKVLYNLDESKMLTANLGAGYDFLADRESISAAYAGAPGSAFRTTGIDPSPWLVNAGVGAEFGAKDQMQLNVRYDVEGREDFTNQSVSFKVKIPF